MSERSSYDALPRHIKKEIRSKLLHFDADVLEPVRADESPPTNKSRREEEAKIPEFEYNPLPPNKK
jgi:hypothetical protein